MENTDQTKLPDTGDPTSNQSTVYHKFNEGFSTGPMRGHSSFPWLDRALDPTTSTTEDNASIKTASFNTRPDGTGAEILVPTVREEVHEDGTKSLVELSESDAYDKALAEDDYLSFQNPEEATAYSKYLSDSIHQRRQDYQAQLEQAKKDKEAKPTPARLPAEVDFRYNQISGVLNNIVNTETSYKSAEAFINHYEDKTADFNLEDGDWSEMDLLRPFTLPSTTVLDEQGQPHSVEGKETTLLKELEKRYPRSNTTPGAERIKNYLKDLIDERDSVLKLRQGNFGTHTLKNAERLKTLIFEGPKEFNEGKRAIGKEFEKVYADIPNIVGNIGYSAAEIISEGIQAIAFSPTYDVFTISNMRNGMSFTDASKLAIKDAKELTEKLFKYSRIAGPKPQPNSLTGQFLAPMGEFGITMMVGAPMYRWGTKLLSKWEPLLAEGAVLMQKGSKALTPSQKVVQGQKKAEKLLAPVTAGTFIQSPEHRLVPFLEDLGASGEWLEFMKDSPNDTVFMRRYKAFLDTSFEAAGFNLFMPTLLLFGRTAYNYGKPISDSVMDKKGDALRVGAAFWDKIKYLYPKAEMDRAIHKARASAQEGKLGDIHKIKENAMNEVQKLLKADKDGSLKGYIERKGYTINEDGLTLQDKLVTRTTPEDLKQYDFVTVGDEKLHFKNLTAAQREEVAKQALKSADDLSSSSQDVFNVSRVNSDDARTKYIHKAAVILDSVMKQGRKGHKETIAEGEKITRQVTAWVGEENVGQYFKKLGDLSTSLPAHMAAVRQYLLEETKHIVRASDKIVQIREAREPTKQELTDYFLDLFKYLGAMETDVKISGNIARTLESRKNILASTEHVLDSIIKGASASGSTGKENIMDTAKMLSHQVDPLGVANIMRRKGPLYNAFEFIKGGAIPGMLSNAMTQTAANLGIMSYAITTRFEDLFSASMNLMSSEFSKRTGKTWLGKGEGMTFKAFNAANFGMSQSLLEIFAGAHFGRRSPLGSAYRAGKNLQVDSMKHHELSDQLATTGHSINLPWVGDVALSRGLTEEVFGEYLDTAFMKGDIGSVMKLMVNSAGLIQSSAGRAIVMTDGFWRNILERMELHKLSYIEATNIERRAAEAAGGTLTNEAVEQTYMYLIRNPDPALIQRARDGAQTGLMQQTFSNKSKVGRSLKAVEGYKNNTSDYRGAKDWIVSHKDPVKYKTLDLGATLSNTGENLAKGALNIADNTARAFVASKFSFMRTMTNIYKQYMYERGFIKLARQIYPENWQKLKTDELYRQETLSKIGSGAMITSMGYLIGSKLAETGAGWFMEGIDASDPDTRYVKQATGTRSPEIMYRTESGDEYSLPLNRLDPLKSSMALGAIFGSYHDQYNEAIALMEDENLQQESIDELERIKNKFLYALGDWIMDVPMMKGVRDTAGSFIPGISPYGPDYQKEPVKFLNNFVNPWISNFSSLRKAGQQIVQPFAAISQKSEKYEYVDLIEDPEFIDSKGGIRPDKRSKAYQKRSFLTKVIDEFREASFKVAFMDRSGDNLLNPKVGQMLYALVGPEGNLVKHLPDTTLGSIERGLKTLAIPVFGKKKIRTNTSDLVLGLRLKYPDPRKWSLPKGVVLTAQQRYEWTVETGFLNKDLFNNGYFSSHVASINNGAIDRPENRRIKVRLKKEVQARIIQNRARAFRKILNPKSYPQNTQLRNQVRQSQRQQALQG